MGKKSAKKSQSTKKTAIREQTPRKPAQFGYDEMLSELEAIVASAAARQEQEETAWSIRPEIPPIPASPHPHIGQKPETNHTSYNYHANYLA